MPDEATPAPGEAEMKAAAEKVSAAAIALRNFIGTIVTAGQSDPASMAAAAVMVAGEIVEQMGFEPEVSEQNALAWFRGGRQARAAFEAGQVAAHNGGKLHG